MDTFIFRNILNIRNGVVLQWAARRGYQNIVSRLIAAGADVNSVDSHNRTALHWAAQKGHSSVVQTLIAAQADVNIVDGEGKTGLHWAAQCGNNGIVHTLIAARADVNTVGRDGKTALHLASHDGCNSVIQTLLSAGADINATDNEGRTALHWAAWEGHTGTVQILIASGANVHMVDSRGQTALNLAAVRGHNSILDSVFNTNSEADPDFSRLAGHSNIAQRLIGTAAGPRTTHLAREEYLNRERDNRDDNLSDINQQTTGTAVLEQELRVAVLQGELEEVNRLIRAGVSVNATDGYGKTPLYWAVMEGHNNVVQTLLAAKANSHIHVGDKCVGPIVHWAAGKGDAGILQAITAAGADVNAVNAQNKTALHLAAEKGHNSIVKILIGAGINVNTADTNNRTAVRIAAMRGHKRVVEALIAAGADVNISDNCHWTPLYWAVERGHKHIVDALIAAGADVHSTDSDGKTALYRAVIRRDSYLTQVLLDAGARVNYSDEYGQTPLHRIARKGDHNVLQILLTAGADINFADSDGRTALHESAIEGHRCVVHTLVTAGADVNTVDIHGVTALHLASERGHADVVLILLGAKANLNTVNRFGETALHLAAQNGCTRVVETLLAAEVKINAADRDGRTALILAAGRRQNKVVEMLAAAGADVNIADSSGMPALHVALNRGNSSGVQILLTSGADVNQGETILNWAARGGYVDTIQFLTGTEININAVDSDGWTALHWAAEEGHISAVQALIEAGADVNISGFDGKAALHTAAEEGHNEVVHTLIDEGANVNTSDRIGGTALRWAAVRGHNAVVQTLITAGADVHAVDCEGWTALHWAVERRNKRVVQTLASQLSMSEKEDYFIWAAEHGYEEFVQSLIVNHGVDVFATNRQGQVALQLALQRDHGNIVHVLTPYMTTDKTLHRAGRTGDDVLLEWLFQHAQNLDIDIPDGDGQTSLNMFVKANNLKAVRLLISRSANPHKKDYCGRSPLILAHEAQDAEMIKALTLASEETAQLCLVLDDALMHEFNSCPLLLQKNICPIPQYESHPHCGKVKLTGIASVIHKEVEEMLTNIVNNFAMDEWCKEVGLHNPSYEMVGSCREQTKIQKPNEFDYLLSFDTSRSCNVHDYVCGLPLCPPGFAYLTCTAKMSPESRQLVCSSLQLEKEEYVTSSAKFHRLFWQKLIEICQSKNFLNGKKLKLKFIPRHGYLESKACSTALLTWTGEKYTDMDIEVDLTLGLKFDFECPFLDPAGLVPNHFYLVPKPPSKTSVLGLAYEDEERENMWKVDFVVLEGEMIANLPQNVKDAYVTCKCIRAIVPPLKVAGDLMNADKLVSSFMIKLLFMRDSETFMKCNMSLEEMVLTILHKLVGYLEDGFLPDLWSFRIPYSENLKEVEQEDMTSYGQPNILAGSKHHIKHCLQVAQLLSFITQELIDYCGIIKKAIQQDGHCTYATLRVYEACSEGDVELAGKLLNCGAVFNIPNDEESTPLDLARAAGHNEMVKWLVDHGWG